MTPHSSTAITQAFNCPPPTAEPWGRSQTSPCWISCKQIGIGSGFYRALWMSSGNIARSPYSFIHSLSSTLHRFSSWERPWIRHLQDRQCTYKSNIKTLLHNHCYRGKTISVTYSDCVCVALVFQHSTRVRHIVKCGACPVVKYLSTL